MRRIVNIGTIGIGRGRPLALIAGPCVIESRKQCIGLAARLARLAKDEGIPLIFKASYDKANRSSHRSYRGPGIDVGLAVLAEVKEKFGLAILTDVHSVSEVESAARVADVLQIPAFLCRQTDLVMAVARSGRVVNVKKGQFLAPWDMRAIVEKVESCGCRRLLLTERGVSFGYNNLVADMRSLLVLRETGYPVVFDATHSVQRPGGAGNRSSGDGRWAPALARAAVATGCDAVFMEVHANPREALSDADNAVALRDLVSIWRVLREIHGVVLQNENK
jgi:2-dehydro-3-deoxyphosphooctonate aldolase (KDO 8-P synthase)